MEVNCQVGYLSDCNHPVKGMDVFRSVVYMWSMRNGNWPTPRGLYKQLHGTVDALR